MRTAILAFTLLFMAGPTAEITVLNLPAKGVTSVPMTPVGKADIERVGTMTQIHIEIEKLQPAQKLAPNMNAYVVWAISPEGNIENIGELGVTDGKGRLDTASRLDRLGLLITAEPHYMVDRPNSFIAFNNSATKPDNMRRLQVMVPVGAYDYSALQPVTAAVPGVVAQARAALQVAAGMQAERLAESEYRLARIALGTVDEMLTRSASPDIIFPFAHESIRRSQRSFVEARDIQQLQNRATPPAR